MKSLILVFLILVSERVWGLAESETQLLNGIWRSEYTEINKTDRKIREIEINYPSIRENVYRYDLGSSPDPKFVHLITGRIVKIQKNQLNPKVFDIDWEVTSDKAVMKDESWVKKYKTESCAKPGVELDIKKSGCGVFKVERNVKKLYDRIMIPSDEEMFAARWIRFPKAEKDRPNFVQIYPLKKKK